MKQTKIVGILIKDRIKEAGRTQLVLSKYNSIIQSRMGFHELSEEVCSRTGIITLTLGGDVSLWPALLQELNDIGGLDVKEMLFEY